MEKKERVRAVKVIFLSTALFFFIGMWVATQIVAIDCQYNELLGARLQLGNFGVFAPYKFYVWNRTLQEVIPHILAGGERYIYISTILGFFFGVLIFKSQKKLITHGSANWANEKDVSIAEVDKKAGVILGINPYTHKLMMHDGPEHILLMAPTRSGKGVCVIIPTCLTWKHSIFVTDVKGENWHYTAGYRKNVLHQKVIKFEPMCNDGSSAKWNPLAEINFRASDEFSDIQNIVTMIVDPEGKGQLDYWATTGSALLIGTIIHLLYSHYQEHRALPTMTNIATFLSSPEHPIDEQLNMMKTYPHITAQEFLSENNILQKIYGEYITDFSPYNETLKCDVHCLNDLKEIIKVRNVDFKSEPFNLLLAHPKVAECAAEMSNKAPNEQSGVLSTAKSFLNLYQNPVIAKNTSISEFRIDDLLDPKQEISFFLVIPPRDLGTLKPLCRLLINSVLRTLIKKMEFDEDKTQKKQRLLLMLDEFPQFGRLDTMEMALSVCAGYGIKVCVVSQDVNQLNKAYTKDNSIASNCHVHVYFTPNLDNNTAPAISKMLGKQTILTQSRSDQGGIFKGSISTSSTARDLMTPDEVSKMDKEKELVFVAGNKPILGKKLRYYKQKFFTKRLLPEPIISDKCTMIADFETLIHIREEDEKKEKDHLLQIEAEKLKKSIRELKVKQVKE
jgi:type IV secretory pathway TraG/TraD family ATPase VirD4